MNRLSENVKQILDKAPDSIVSEYLRTISDKLEENYNQKLNSSICSIVPSKNCFLSVVIRTQGKRNRLLLEALDSLNSQTCQDFEIIIVGHKVNEADKRQLSELINNLNDKLKEKITLDFLDKGNRTAPLNYGFSISSGKYFAVLDDDDVVLPRWVELFSENACGKLLHCYCYEQDWKTVDNKSVSVSDYKDVYLSDFILKRQIQINMCPLHSLAFPSFLFRDFAFVFDESLSTNEDWDFLMRTAMFAGIKNIREPGCIYKKWIDIENSVTRHSKSEWRNCEEQLKNKLLNMNICLSKEDTNIYVSDADSYVPEGKKVKSLLAIYRHYTLLKVCNILTLGLVPGIKNKAKFYKDQINDILNRKNTF